MPAGEFLFCAERHLYVGGKIKQKVPLKSPGKRKWKLQTIPFKYFLAAQHLLSVSSRCYSFVGKQNDTLAGVVNEIKVMAGDKLGARQVVDHMNQTTAVAWIKSNGWLIKKHQLAMHGEHSGDAGQFFLTARQLVNLLVTAVFKADQT